VFFYTDINHFSIEKVLNFYVLGRKILGPRTLWRYTNAVIIIIKPNANPDVKAKVKEFSVKATDLETVLKDM